MLNISSTTAVSWPTPASTAVAPVSPAAAVQPVQAGGHDGKSQTGFGRERQAEQQQGVVVRMGGEGARAPSTDNSAAPPSIPAGPQAPAHDPVAQRQARQEATAAAEQQQAKGKKTVEHLQQVLSSMWEASAAVVDRALGIEPSKTDALGNQSDTAPDLSAVTGALVPRKLAVSQRLDKPAQEPPALAWSGASDAIDGEDGTVAMADPLINPAEVIAYDERGVSSLAPLEAGSIVDERV
ncbi:hypothetical protein [Hydrogenophaga sp. BPS33]|uniref:hypothetical protein n=1 Tax=Hydrogenophaga sp. BPS33 TaxID=2651974 RepID=UPI00132014ED|nr:hypothetical protein [Hydrogenophaga sp. BPS33]QHE88157.1 hypothetical protein F9K07_26295 [Hydrogenophaga sp. BPS33]